MTERIVNANGIEIWTEDFGDPGDPALLLVMGATAQGIAWPDEFCELLAQGGRYVIRYDNRDTGQSTCRDYATHPYTVSDMALDAVGVLDAYGIERAHVAGASMGGMICQALAIEHPERVCTLTSIMSSPGGATTAAAISGDTTAATLPPPEPKVVEVMMARFANPPSTREEQIDAGLAVSKVLAGSLATPDEAELRAMQERVIDRARDTTAAMNHALAVAASPDRQAGLAGVTLPTLVIHGTEDPILPFAHGEATAKAIPGATLLAIEGMGHDLPRPAWPTITQAILAHTA